MNRPLWIWSAAAAALLAACSDSSPAEGDGTHDHAETSTTDSAQSADSKSASGAAGKAAQKSDTQKSDRAASGGSSGSAPASPSGGSKAPGTGGSGGQSGSKDAKRSSSQGGAPAQSKRSGDDDAGVSTSTSEPQTPAATTGQAEPTGAKPTSSDTNWVGFGGGVEQSFARASAAIDKSNLAQLGLAWEKMAPGGVTGTPAIFDNVVYWTDWVGNVHADKASDGTEVWSHTYSRGFTSSPFVTDKALYLSNRDNMVYKLDRATGKELWATAVTDAEVAQLWSSPTVADGVVIVGIGGKGTSDGGAAISSSKLMAFHGGVVGLDDATGAVRWHWDNTVGPDGMQYGPGVSSWSTAAIDPTRKVAYIGTGNSYYTPASPYSDSIIALDYTTSEAKGHLVWSRQFTKDDNFTSGSPRGPDYDVGATPNLYSLGGKDYVAVGDKGGHVYIMDRQSGELLSTTAAGTGSSTGGVMAPAAYGDGALYQAANRTGSTVVQRINAATGKSEWSTTLSGGVCFGAPLLLKDVLLVGTNSGFPGSRATPGKIVALDRTTGEQLPDFSLSIPNQRGGGISVYHNTLFIPYGFVFENTRAESTLAGGVVAIAVGGKAIAPPTTTAPAVTHAPTYSAIYDEILEPQGCTADRCHGGLGLKLATREGGYMSLLNDVGVGACAGQHFVVAGKPDESLLYSKVADAMPRCGSRMPLSLAPLTAEELMQIRGWIEMGAPNN